MVFLSLFDFFSGILDLDLQGSGFFGIQFLILQAFLESFQSFVKESVLYLQFLYFLLLPLDLEPNLIIFLILLDHILGFPFQIEPGSFFFLCHLLHTLLGVQEVLQG